MNNLRKQLIIKAKTGDPLFDKKTKYIFNELFGQDNYEIVQHIENITTYVAYQSKSLTELYFIKIEVQVDISSLNRLKLTNHTIYKKLSSVIDNKMNLFVIAETIAEIYYILKNNK